MFRAAALRTLVTPGVRHATSTAAKHRKVIKQAKGYYGRSKNTFRAARRRLDKAMQYAYRDRRTKKREFRAQWVHTVNAAAREHGVKYSELAWALKDADIKLNKKVLAELAVTEPLSFAGLTAALTPAVKAKREAAKVSARNAQAAQRAASGFSSRKALVADISLDDVITAVRDANASK